MKTIKVKDVIAGVLVCSFLLGGSVVAMAQGGSSSSTSVYDKDNEKITKAWNKLSKAQQLYLLTHPSAVDTKDFPFGLDILKGAPKGYPTCLEAEYPAYYAATAPTPDDCAPSDDHDNGHGNNDDHDDDSNPGHSHH